VSEEWTTLRVLEWTTGRFTEAEMDSPRLEAQVLLAHALKCDRVALYMQYDKPLGEPELAAYRALIRRRLDGEPVAYLTGQQEFWSLPFNVDKRVLIPRRDSETIIEVVRDETDLAAPARLLDIATGSGVLAITMLREMAQATAVATDLSRDALDVAKDNAVLNDVVARIEFRQGDLLQPLTNEDEFNVVISNPPYIATNDVPTLSSEVRHEPTLALDGGPDGLEYLRRIISDIHGYISANGLLVLEHAFDQDAAVRKLIDATHHYGPAQTRNDLAGQPRVTWARRKAA